MAITKETVIETIRIVGKWNIEIATDTVIKEDGIEISRSRHRHSLKPYLSSYLCKDESTEPVLDANGKKQWTHTDTDISKEATEVQAICNTVWTTDIKNAYKTWKESQEV